jgi:hypothetical protein
MSAAAAADVNRAAAIAAAAAVAAAAAASAAAAAVAATAATSVTVAAAAAASAAAAAEVSRAASLAFEGTKDAMKDFCRETFTMQFPKDTDAGALDVVDPTNRVALTRVMRVMLATLREFQRLDETSALPLSVLLQAMTASSPAERTAVLRGALQPPAALDTVEHATVAAEQHGTSVSPRVLVEPRGSKTSQGAAASTQIVTGDEQMRREAASALLLIACTTTALPRNSGGALHPSGVARRRVSFSPVPLRAGGFEDCKGLENLAREPHVSFQQQRWKRCATGNGERVLRPRRSAATPATCATTASAAAATAAADTAAAVAAMSRHVERVEESIQTAVAALESVTEHERRAKNAIAHARTLGRNLLRSDLGEEHLKALEFGSHGERLISARLCATWSALQRVLRALGLREQHPQQPQHDETLRLRMSLPEQHHAFESAAGRLARLVTLLASGSPECMQLSRCALVRRTITLSDALGDTTLPDVRWFGADSTQTRGVPFVSGLEVRASPTIASMSDEQQEDAVTRIMERLFKARRMMME